MSLPERQASAQVQAVPREGVAFNDVVTQRVTIETVDPESRTVAFTLPDGQLVILPVADSVGTWPRIHDGSMANVTYTEVVTMLNLRQKGPGSKDARKDQMNKTPNQTDIECRPLHADRRRRRSRQQHRLGDRRPRRRGPDLRGEHDRQAGHAEEDQGRRRGDRPDDAADGHGDLAGALRSGERRPAPPAVLLECADVFPEADPVIDRLHLRLRCLSRTRPPAGCFARLRPRHRTGRRADIRGRSPSWA